MAEIRLPSAAVQNLTILTSTPSLWRPLHLVSQVNHLLGFFFSSRLPSLACFQQARQGLLHDLYPVTPTVPANVLWLY